MRATIQILAGVAMMMATPALADPAYKASDVVEFFHKAKEAKLGGTRAICFDDESNCKTAAPKPFDLMVNFEFDSDHLTPAAQTNLGEFRNALHDPQLKGQKFGIDGFTDATGTEIYNQHLSERRAEAVVSVSVIARRRSRQFDRQGIWPNQAARPRRRTIPSTGGWRLI